MHKGKKYLITGGTRGIGCAAVRSLSLAGADIAFTYQSNTAAAQSLCDELQANGKVVAIQADVVNFQLAKETIEQVKESLGGLDGLILNAGINRDKLLYAMAEEDWDDVITTNLKGTFNYARAAIYSMIKQKCGRVICISSVSGLTGIPGQSNYSTSKAGQIGFVKSLSKEVAKYGITVNAIAPGFIETEMWESIKEKHREQILKEIPMGRAGHVDDVTHAISYLLSPQASYITGSVFVIDGGLSA